MSAANVRRWSAALVAYPTRGTMDGQSTLRNDAGSAYERASSIALSLLGQGAPDENCRKMPWTINIQYKDTGGGKALPMA